MSFNEEARKQLEFLSYLDSGEFYYALYSYIPPFELNEITKAAPESIVKDELKKLGDYLTIIGKKMLSFPAWIQHCETYSDVKYVVTLNRVPECFISKYIKTVRKKGDQQYILPRIKAAVKVLEKAMKILA